MGSALDTMRVTPGSLQVPFHVGRDVRWHDSTLTTGGDIPFTFERAKEPKTASPYASMLQLYTPRGAAGQSGDGMTPVVAISPSFQKKPPLG